MTAKRYLIVPMLAILFVLAFVAQSLAITAFGGPVRRGHDQKTEIVLSGFGLRIMSKAPETTPYLKSKKLRVRCRMIRGNKVWVRSSKKGKIKDKSIRFKFSSPLPTVGRGACRLITKNGSAVISFKKG